MKENNDLFSPAKTFILLWTFFIGVTDLKFSRFQYEWSIYSWLMIFIALSSVLLGMYTVFILNSSKSILTIRKIRLEKIYLNVNRPLLFKIILFMFLMYLVSYLSIYLIHGFVPYFSKAPDATRQTFTYFGFGLFLQMVPSICFFCFLYSFENRNIRSKKYIIYFILIVTIISYMLILQRYYLMLPLILIVLFYYYLTNKLKLKYTIIIICLFSLIIYGISSLRTTHWVVNLLYYISQMKFSPKYAIFTEPYMYIAMNLENFAKATDLLNIFDYGWNTFDFIFALTGIKHWVEEYSNINHFPHIITSTYNTYTMFFIYYKDFGIIGLIFLPYLFGFITSSAYYRFRNIPKISSFSIWAMLFFVIVFSFFVPILHWLHFIFNLFVIYFVAKLIERPRNINSINLTV